MQTLPYGTWPSPLSAADLASGAISLDDLAVDGDDLLWTEGRPDNEGRSTLVRWSPGKGAVDISPPDFNVRNGVHEYGGAAFTARGGVAIASNFADQRLHRLDGDGATPVTEEPQRPKADRFADARISADGRWLVTAHERHHEDRESTNDIAAVDLSTGELRTLVSGRDFVMCPRLSPDDGQLAWLAWDHPNMPWDAAELWVADFADGEISNAEHLGGGRDDAANSPTWTPDGDLVASFDASGFWEVHHQQDGTWAKVSSFGADAGGPAWNFGQQELAVLPDGRIGAIVTRDGTCTLQVMASSDGSVVGVDLGSVQLSHLQTYRDGFALLGRRPNGDGEVIIVDSDLATISCARTVTAGLADGDVPAATHVVVDLPGDEVTHAFFFAPTNGEVVGPEGEAPPLIVFTHGGPTGHVPPVAGPGITYWTSRGFAVANVNYRGSTGHGRAYRERLRGQWGVLDVEDVIAVARHLADEGLVDGARMAIRGGSAGGFTTLAALTAADHPFAAGTSFFGVADLKALADHTHKFESRYLDQVVGPLPQAQQTYVDRSPITHVDRLSCPVFVLQGLDDKVVLPAQAEAIVEAAKERGLPHAYIAFEGEGHGFRKAQNIITWLESELSFYGQVFGFEPAGDITALELRTS